MFTICIEKSALKNHKNNPKAVLVNVTVGIMSMNCKESSEKYEK